MTKWASSAVVLGALLAMISPAVVSAGVINLHGIADGDSAYYEYVSDAFFRMDLVEPPPNEHQQQFHLISDPDVVIGGPGFDGFPNDEDFRLGNVTYDESTLVDGTGTSNLTAMVLGIGADPNDPAFINYGRWTDIATTVDSFSGSVEFVDYQPIAMTLNSAVTVTAFGGAIVATGTFDVAGDQFTGLMTMPGAASWDFSGTLTTVPEPVSLLLVLMGVGAVARRRAH